MAKKGGQAVLQEEINSDDDWTKIIEKPGMYGKKKKTQNYVITMIVYY